MRGSTIAVVEAIELSLQMRPDGVACACADEGLLAAASCDLAR